MFDRLGPTNIVQGHWKLVAPLTAGETPPRTSVVLTNVYHCDGPPAVQSNSTNYVQTNLTLH